MHATAATITSGSVSDVGRSAASKVPVSGLRLLKQQIQTDEQRLSSLRVLTEEGFRSLDIIDVFSVNNDDDLPAAIARPGREVAFRVDCGHLDGMALTLSSGGGPPVCCRAARHSGNAGVYSERL